MIIQRKKNGLFRVKYPCRGEYRHCSVIWRHWLASPYSALQLQGGHKVFSWKQTFITRELYVAPQLKEFQAWIILQQDGAPPHWGSHICQFLDVTFPHRWIGRDCRTPWPPWSPDITPLGFFLWGYVKVKVFSTPVPDITNLKARITDAFATATEDMLENTWRETDYRFDVLLTTKGAHVEVYWCVVKKKNLLSYISKKKSLYSTYSSFLIMNVCNQEKTLCSPCIKDKKLILLYSERILVKQIM